jgi:hypothetical protein
MVVDYKGYVRILILHIETTDDGESSMKSFLDWWTENYIVPSTVVPAIQHMIKDEKISDREICDFIKYTIGEIDPEQDYRIGNYTFILSDWEKS